MTELPARPKRFVRMWHQKNNEWCHAFDVEDTAYRAWKEGTGPLSRFAVFLPDGNNPALRSQVVCGTCKSSQIVPKDMKQEFMRL
jgi:hypothetical protein